MAREFAKAFYNSKEWQKVRNFVLMRDKYLCAKCGNPAEEVHHIIHLSSANIYDVNITLNPSNLICLCRDCHFVEHKADKINGIREKSIVNLREEVLEFDANGYLVRKCMKNNSPH